MSRLHKFPLMSKEELANSPSRADGVPENMELRRRKLAAQHMMEVSNIFRMSVATWAIAVTFFNRFYTRKSMKKNNTFIIACASLFLAGKAQNEAKPHTTLANELIKAWYGKDNPQLKALAAAHQATQAAQQQQRGGGFASPAVPPGVDFNFYTNMWAAVLEAERALLYTVGFDFNVELIHTYLARLCNRPRMKAVKLDKNKYFQQQLVSMANDVYKKDGTLALQYSVEKIAIAAFYFILKAAKASKMSSIPQLAPLASGMPWYVEEGLSTAECIEITNRFTILYDQSKRKAAGGGAATPSTAITSGGEGAASTVVLGACESAAYSGGPTLHGLPGGRSELGSGADALGEHTSVPRPLSSDVGSGSMPSKRAAHGPNNVAVPAAAAGYAVRGSPNKRARLAEPSRAASNEATSAAMRPPASRQPSNSPLAMVYHGTIPVASSTTHTPAAAGSAAAPSAALAASSGAAAAADSDKEEGELEEGELS